MQFCIFRSLTLFEILVGTLRNIVLTISFLSESGAFHAKSAYKKENGTHAYVGSSSSASAVAGNNLSRRPPSYRLLLFMPHTDSLLKFFCIFLVKDFDT